MHTFPSSPGACGGTRGCPRGSAAAPTAALMPSSPAPGPEAADLLPTAPAG